MERCQVSGLLRRWRAQALEKAPRSAGVSRARTHTWETFCFVSERKQMQTLCHKRLYLCSAGCRGRSEWLLTKGRIWMTVFKRPWTFCSRSDRLIPSKILNTFSFILISFLKLEYLQGTGETHVNSAQLRQHLESLGTPELFPVYGGRGQRSPPHFPGFTQPNQRWPVIPPQLPALSLRRVSAAACQDPGEDRGWEEPALRLERTSCSVRCRF